MDSRRYRVVVSDRTLALAYHPLSVLRHVNEAVRHQCQADGLLKGPMRTRRESLHGVEVVICEWDGHAPR